jgi:hypothetical protein
MNRKSIYLLFHTTALTVLLALSGCSFLDPTEVENPLTTDEDLANASEPTKALLPGLRAQFARVLNGVVSTTEFASDNFSVNGTGFDNTIDFPADISSNTGGVSGTGGTQIYWNLQELRALADFVLDEIAPGDETATPEQIAEARYYRGMAFLMQGENFTALPVEPDGLPVRAGDLLQRAITDLQAAVNGPLSLGAKAALARAYRAAGNTAQAAQLANDALAEGGNDFLFVREYDASSITNIPQNFLVDRALQEMQPLPRLDFLDPKYLVDESAIPIAKAEEMFLILAEVALAGNDLATARQQMIAAINLALSRPVVSFDDQDQRLDNELNIRPRNAEIMIADDPQSPFRAGLVKARPGVIDVPVISGTSVTADQVNGAGSSEDLTRLLYLLRQEIMFLEGRRLHDLGIRLPIMLREIEQNPNINDGDTGTQVSVPGYIPPRNEMDLYSPLVLYDSGELDANLVETQVMMLHDMNKILATQRGLVVMNPLLPN